MPASPRLDRADGPRPDSGVEVGIGLRAPHWGELLGEQPRLGFVEVHSENYFADGGAALAALRDARAAYPVSLHGVGLGLGSAAGLDAWHLERLARLVDRIAPVRVSDHAAFARAALSPGARPVHANDLLPLAFTPAALDILVDNVGRVQDRLKRTILVENLAAYLSFTDDSLPEPEFFADLCRRSGCGLLLDLNNLMVNAVNAANAACAKGRAGGAAGPTGRDSASPLAACLRFIDALPHGIVGELHLAGYRDSATLLIDDHGSRVRPAVWALYRHTLRRFGALPTLIEWDTALPPLAVLLDEAGRAATCAAQVSATAAVA